MDSLLVTFLHPLLVWVFPQVWELLILRGEVDLFADHNKSNNAATLDYKALPLLHRPDKMSLISLSKFFRVCVTGGVNIC